MQVSINVPETHAANTGRAKKKGYAFLCHEWNSELEHLADLREKFDGYQSFLITKNKRARPEQFGIEINYTPCAPLSVYYEQLQLDQFFEFGTCVIIEIPSIASQFQLTYIYLTALNQYIIIFFRLYLA